MPITGELAVVADGEPDPLEHWAIETWEWAGPIAEPEEPTTDYENLPPGDYTVGTEPGNICDFTIPEPEEPT